jgi:hypothetical protein
MAKQAVEDFSVVVSYADIAAKNYSLSAGQYFDVKIEYSDLTPAQFAEKFYCKLGYLLEQEIKKQLAGLRWITGGVSGFAANWARNPRRQTAGQHPAGADLLAHRPAYCRI